ncbi:hypothetical protein AB0H82_19265 [Streptomyces sp. NPDC050732]|uniref:hypothetical protein n=1 Tax=Streptomyces sp. NPDC050732 TaxID=3154632 RepID=UPI003448BF7C
MPYAAMTRTAPSTTAEQGFRVHVMPGTSAEHILRVQELLELQRMARKLWDCILGGQGTDRMRARVERLEAAQAALMGAPELFAQCGSCGHVPDVSSEALPAAA